jgi:ketosteroid isomerase-like protein
MRSGRLLVGSVTVTLLVGTLLTIGSAVFSAARATAPQTDADVMAVERTALERWGKGDPGGFLDTYAPEITYFDPSVERRVDGLPAMKALLEPVRGKLRIDRREILNPKVQRYGEIAVLSYNIVNYEKQADGTERQMRPWNVTEVFRLVDGKWRTIHSHFSFTKPELK